MRVRHVRLRADAQAVCVKHHTVARAEAHLDSLPRAKMHVAGQQNLHIVMPVTLTEQIGVVAEPFHHLAVKGEGDVCLRVSREMLRANTERDGIAGLQRRGIERQTQRFTLARASRPARLFPSARRSRAENSSSASR